MPLGEELEQIAAAAAAHSSAGEAVTGVVAAEPHDGERVYLCAFANGDGRSWLALDERAEPVARRSIVREAALIAAMCEVAGEAAGGGHLEELRAQLLTLRLTENPPGIDEAEDAALALEAALGGTPFVASPERLDAIGVATRRLERALGDDSGSPFAEAVRQALPAVEALADEIVRGSKVELA